MLFHARPDDGRPKNGFDLSYLYVPQDAEVWPENWPIWRVFARLTTQWRFAGMGGRTGLDYAAVYPLLDRLFPNDPQEWDFALDDIRVMESAALDQMNLDQS